MAEGGMLLYTCDLCGQDGLSDDEMRTHILLEHVEKSITCPFCDLQGTTLEEMNLHINAVHPDFMTPSLESKGFPQHVMSDSSSETSTSDWDNTKTSQTQTPGDSGSSSEVAMETSDESPSVNGQANDGASFNIVKQESIDKPVEVSIEMTLVNLDTPMHKPPHNSVSRHHSPSKYEDGASVCHQSPSRFTGGSPARHHSPSRCDGGLTGSPAKHLCGSPCHFATASGSPSHSGTPRHNGSFQDERLIENLDTQEQQKRRAKLHLNVPQVHIPIVVKTVSNEKVLNTQNQKSNPPKLVDQPQTSHKTCPMCSYHCISADDMEVHVNRAHLDALTPSKPRQANDLNANPRMKTPSRLKLPEPVPSTSKAQFDCPICGQQFANSAKLEKHVNTSHVDILSPEGNANVSGAPLAMPEDTNNLGHLCPVCGLEFADNKGLQAHVNGHFSAGPSPAVEASDSLVAQELERREQQAAKAREQKDFEKLQAVYGMNNKNNYRKQADRNLEHAVVNGQMSIADYYDRRIEVQQAHSTGVDDGHSATKGIITHVRQYYRGHPASLRHVWLCSTVDHYASSYGDKGWGCGYRNIQMLLSSLSNSPVYERLLFNGRAFIPSIPKIQKLIEAAWQKGFDTQGCEQLGGKVANTTKWIGATEIVALLASLKVKCHLVDFHTPTRRDGTHPRLMEWVRDYFRRPGDFKPPLYLQHQGHSRTIVGIEELKDNSLRLLIFDPGCSKRQMQHFQGNVDGNVMRSIRRTLQGLKAKQYQIVAVIGTLSDREYEESKTIRSERIP